METLLLIIGLMTYDTDGGGGVSNIHINQTYESKETCELILSKYIKAYELMSEDRFITIKIAENSCTKLVK